jgi:hypothetical protein
MAAATSGLLVGCEERGQGGVVATPTPVPTPTPTAAPLPTATFAEEPLVLTEPFLQLPTADSVRVVWFTEFRGRDHAVRYGTGFAQQVAAVSTPLSRMYEDANSTVGGRSYTGLTQRDIWRHEATVTGLAPGRQPYVAIGSDGVKTMRSVEGSLQPLPAAGQATRFLLTSDLQLKKMASANYERVSETLAPIDVVLFAGDLVNVPNRASEWFDNNVLNLPPFFAALQGTMRKWQPLSTYTGGPLLQNGVIYPILGNHEYSGRWNPANNLNTMFNDPQPRWYAEMQYDKVATTVNPSGDAAIRERWIRDNSFEIISYSEVFTLPQGPEGGRYYAQRIGDTFLIAMDGNRIWRGWGANTRGKLTEATASLNDPSQWGFGDFQFHPFARGSRQYQWLQEVLASDAFKSAKYKIVMVHQSVFGLGDNATPVMAQTQATFEYSDAAGAVQTMGPFAFPIDRATWNGQIQPVLDAGRMRYVKYDYPLAGDLWRNEVEPLLVAAGVQLVQVGHSHLWCRSKVGGMHYLETSNVGNSYGAYVAQLAPRRSAVPADSALAGRTSLRWNQDDYPREDDPHDRPMALPSLRNPQVELAGATENVPFLSSNDVTAYSVFDTSTGIVASYAFDTRYPARDPIKFDEFRLA